MTHSRALAWKIPWTEEPGGLQSMGSQRVGKKRVRHNLAAEQRQITLTACLHMLSINSFFNCGKIYIT